LAYPRERTGEQIWVVRVELLNGNRQYFAFKNEDEAREFRTRVITGGDNIKRAQEFAVPVCRFVERD